MKKVITVFLFILFCCSSYSFGKIVEQDSSLQSRNIQQQLFVYEYIKANEPKDGFESSNQVLNFMKNLSNAWAETVSNQSEVYKRFNTYAPMWAVYTLFKNQLPAGSKCLVYSEIALPSFIKDVAFLKEQLQNKNANLTEAAFLIRTANLSWAVTQPLTYSCDLKAEQWQSLKEATANYPSIIQKYLEANALPNTKTEEYRQSYQKVLSTAKAIQPYIDLQNKIYQNEFPDVFAELAAEFPNSGSYRYIYVEIAKNLFEKYKNRNETDLAFATLDLLARNTSEESLSRNELRSMYTEADPRLGPSRFESVNTKVSSELSVSDSKQRLTGKYFNAQRGKYVQLNIPSDEIVLLDFWSVSCGPCIDEIPKLNDLAKQYGDTIRLISVNNDLLYGSTKEELQKFVAEHNIQYPVILDTEQKNLMQKFGVNGWPARFLLNEEGYFFEVPVENRIKLSLSEIENCLKAN